jgi:hypothetical protein
MIAVEGIDADGGSNERREKNREETVDGEVFEVIEARRAFEEIADTGGSKEHFADVDEDEKGDGTKRNAMLEVVENEAEDPSGDQVAPMAGGGNEQDGDKNGAAGPVGPEGLGSGNDQGVSDPAGEVANTHGDEGEDRRVETTKARDKSGHGFVMLEREVGQVNEAVKRQ